MNFNITILGQAISFFFFVLFCMKFIWPPILSIIETRQKEISTALKNSEQIKLDIQLTNKQIAKKIEIAKVKALLIIEEAHRRKTEILESVELEAEKKKNLIISEAYSNIEIKRNKVHKELIKEISSLAIVMAEKIIQNTIKNDTFKINDANLQKLSH